jgi:hypothetical protein
MEAEGAGATMDCEGALKQSSLDDKSLTFIIGSAKVTTPSPKNTCRAKFV